MGIRSIGVWAVCGVWIGCGDGGGRRDALIEDAAPPDAGAIAMKEIGIEGGKVELGGVVLDIPAGSVGGPTTITIEVSSQSAPGGAFGPLYEFGPPGLVFGHPVEVSLPLPASVSGADVYWSKPG